MKWTIYIGEEGSDISSPDLETYSLFRRIEDAVMREMKFTVVPQPEEEDAS